MTKELVEKPDKVNVRKSERPSLIQSQRPLTPPPLHQQAEAGHDTNQAAQISWQSILNNRDQVAHSALGGGRPFIQTKLTLGPVGDKYEQEADSVAQQVVGKINNPQAQTAQRQEEEEMQMKPISSLQRQEEEEMMAKRIQRQEEDELQMKPISNLQSPISSLQRQEEDEMMAKRIQRQEEEEMQMKPISNLQSPISSLQRQEEEEMMAKGSGDTLAGGPVSGELESEIQGARGGGQPIADNVRGSMESALGADFSGVRVHTDSQSDSLNQSIQARAFTTGQDIFFRSGEYNPGSSGGQELLAHELTHVVQQNSSSVQRDENQG